MRKWILFWSLLGSMVLLGQNGASKVPLTTDEVLKQLGLCGANLSIEQRYAQELQKENDELKKKVSELEKKLVVKQMEECNPSKDIVCKAELPVRPDSK